MSPLVGIVDLPPILLIHQIGLSAVDHCAAQTLHTRLDTSSGDRFSQDQPTALQGPDLARIGDLEDAQAQMQSQMTELVRETVIKELAVLKIQIIEDITVSRTERMQGVFAVMA